MAGSEVSLRPRRCRPEPSDPEPSEAEALAPRRFAAAVAGCPSCRSRSLKDDADVAEHLANGSPGGARGQRVVVERLDDVEVLLAAVAAVFVGRQAGGPLGPDVVDWQST